MILYPGHAWLSHSNVGTCVCSAVREVMARVSSFALVLFPCFFLYIFFIYYDQERTRAPQRKKKERKKKRGKKKERNEPMFTFDVTRRRGVIFLLFVCARLARAGANCGVLVIYFFFFLFRAVDFFF